MCGAGDDLTVANLVLGLCYRAQNFPMTNHIHVCDKTFAHEDQHRCYFCNEKWWHDQFDNYQSR